jgi:hypothetical protein
MEPLTILRIISASTRLQDSVYVPQMVACNDDFFIVTLSAKIGASACLQNEY